VTRDVKTANTDTLNADWLVQQLNPLAEQKQIRGWCLAYSGGVDSQVLLHLLSLTKLKITAIYIDHGLQPQSARWASHCENQCLQVNIPFRVIKVDAAPQKGESPEAAARNARYGAFNEVVEAGMCLLTAQHQQDQSETVLLQLLRGAGAAGLAAMPLVAAFAKGWHSRPLLHISQQAILEYAEKYRLSWIEDPSNQQQSFDRNYLRHSVIPKIQQRWPALNKTLSIFSEQQAENAALLEILAEIDLQTARIRRNQLNIEALKKLSDARLRNALRYWFKNSVPPRAVLQQIIRQMLEASHQTSPLVSWGDNEIRRYRNDLYALKKVDHDPGRIYTWSTLLGADNSLTIGCLGIKLQMSQRHAEGAYYLSRDIFDRPLTIRFRLGGEHIKPAGRKGHRDLKSLFQEAAVPPWQRDRIPLLYSGRHLAAVVGYWVEDAFSAKDLGWFIGSEKIS